MFDKIVQVPKKTSFFYVIHWSSYEQKFFQCLNFYNFLKEKVLEETYVREKKKTNWILCFKMTSIRLLYDFLLQSYDNLNYRPFFVIDSVTLFVVTAFHETIPHNESKQSSWRHEQM